MWHLKDVGSEIKVTRSEIEGLGGMGRKELICSVSGMGSEIKRSEVICVSKCKGSRNGTKG